MTRRPRPDLRVRAALRQARSGTTAQIAQLAQVHPRQARHWLECMFEAGEAARSERPRHGRGKRGWLWEAR